MNHNSPPLEPDYPPSSSMSEGDSLSDSDWLEISSNRESDDNDSVMSGDSDRDDVGLMPLSRRSSMSIGSSRDGDVDAWEGFVDDSSDEEPRNVEPDLDIPVPAVDDISMGASELTVNAEHDPDEEQRVKEGLDQSMISTLSASRSSSASVHTSLRDLRLSFPDPLTSSRDELNRSFEQVSPSDTTFSATDLPTDVPTDVPADVVNASLNVIVPAESTDAPNCKEDPGSLYSTPEVSAHEVPILVNEAKVKFEVVLYGAPSEIKWSFVQDLVRRAVLASNLTYTDVIPSSTEPTRNLNIQSTIGGVSSISHFIPVHDRTGDVKTTETDIVKCPSLAVLYLPASIHALPEHTLYLPVLVPSSSSAEELSRTTAANDWKTLSIPPSKVARLSLAQSPVFDSREINEVQDMRAFRLFQRLVSEAKKRQAKSLVDHLSPAHAVTLFALMSLFVGFAMNTAFRRPSTPTPTATSSTTAPAITYWGMFGPEYNQTSVSDFVALSNAPAVTNKEFTLSIINPGTTSLSITSNNAPMASTSATHPKVDAGHCESSASWTEKAASTATDVLVRPGTQMSVHESSMTNVPSSLWLDGASSSKALNVVAHSISEVLDFRMSRLRTDLAELVGSLDELSQAIHRQTKKRVDISKGKAKQIRERVETISKGKAKEVIEHVEHLSKGKAKEIRDRVEHVSKGKVKEFRETVQYRHDRAREKAKELRKKGEGIIHAAGEQLIGRTTAAKKKAHDIGDTVANAEPWRSYKKVHADWVKRLKEKSHSNEGHNRRRKPTGSCREEVQTTSAPSFFSWSYAEIYLA